MTKATEKPNEQDSFPALSKRERVGSLKAGAGQAAAGAKKLLARHSNLKCKRNEMAEDDSKNKVKWARPKRTAEVKSDANASRK